MPSLYGMNILKYAHQSPFPSIAAGQWVYHPEQAKHPSTQHLQCLNQERQGNCHNMATKHARPKQGLINATHKGHIENSPGMFQAMDPYVWESNLTE